MLYLIVARWILSYLLMPFWLVPAIVAGPFYPNLSFRLIQSWCRLALKIFGIEVEVAGEYGNLNKSRAYLFVQLNQSSLIESIVLPRL